MSIDNKHFAYHHLENNLDFYFLFNNKKILGSPSGLKNFDTQIEGFFGLCGLTGEPGKGKTTFAIQTAIHNAFILNKPVLYISLEVNKDMLIAKMISHLTKIPVKKILKGGLTYEEAVDFFKALRLISLNENLIILDNSCCDFQNIENTINYLKENHINLYNEKEEVLVVLDYLNIFSSTPEEWMSKLQQLEKSPHQMKELIRLKNETQSNWIVILTKNKQSYGHKGMGVLKGANDLEYGFETLLTLEDPDSDFPISDYPSNDKGFKEVNTIAYCFKNRWGENKKIIPFYFNGLEGHFYEPFG